MNKLVLVVVLSWFSPIGSLVSQDRWWDYGYEGKVPRVAERTAGVISGPLGKEPVIGSEAYWLAQQSAARTEVRRMRAAGIDGVLFDMLPRTAFDPRKYSADDIQTHATENEGLFRIWLDAAKAESPNFKVGIFLDVRQASAENPSGTVPTSAQWVEIITSLVKQYGQHPNLLRFEGKPVVFHFGTASTRLPNGSGWSGGWEQVLVDLKKRNVRVFFCSDLRPTNDALLRDWLRVSDGVQMFAPGSPISFGEHYQSHLLDLANEANKTYVWGVYPGYYVRDRWFSVPTFERYDKLWRSAISSGARVVEVLTWNDVSESTDIWPSNLNSTVRIELTKFYSEAFKHGAITRPSRPMLFLACPVQIHNLAKARTAQWPNWHSDNSMPDNCYYWGASGVGKMFLSVPGVGEVAIGPDVSYGDVGVVKRAGSLTVKVRLPSGITLEKHTRPILDGSHATEDLNYFYLSLVPH